MNAPFQTFLRTTHQHATHWHPSHISERAHHPEPDPSTPKCRVVDHTQAFRRRFSKTKPLNSTGGNGEHGGGSDSELCFLRSLL